jgi:hypothetical protein
MKNSDTLVSVLVRRVRQARPLHASLCAVGVIAATTALAQHSDPAQHDNHERPSLRPEQPIYVLHGEGSGNYPGFGYSIANLGDADGDGVPDIVVGEPYELAFFGGKVKVYSGRTGAPLLPPITQPGTQLLGFSVAGISDVDGDGHADILVGDPMFSAPAPSYKGQAFVFSGSNGALLFHVTGDTVADEFGYSVAGVGDIDGDGVPDWAVGATQDSDSSNGSGFVRLFSGATSAVIRTYITKGFHKRFGQSLVNVGDINGDGVPDLLIGCSKGNFVQMRSGATGAVLWQKSGPSLPFSGLGWCVANAGDWDGDGVPDLVIGDPGASMVQIRRATDGALLTEIDGPTNVFFGGAVAGLGDVDHDGYGDVAIGAKWMPGGASATGAAWIYSGHTHMTIASYTGMYGDYLGFALAAVGDLDGDGILDLAIGATQDNNGGPGFVAVFSGAR